MTNLSLRLVLLSGLIAGPALAQSATPAAPMTCSQHCEMMAKAEAANTTMAQASPPAMPGMSHGTMPGMQGSAMPGMQQGTMPMSPNHMEMMQKMEAMNKAMMGAPMTGNPDRDLVVMMMPHHQGAIDMARIYLRDGKDPEMRRMAEKIIADQVREIAEMRDWLTRHPAR